MGMRLWTLKYQLGLIVVMADLLQVR